MLKQKVKTKSCSLEISELKNEIINLRNDINELLLIIKSSEIEKKQTLKLDTKLPIFDKDLIYN